MAWRLPPAPLPAVPPPAARPQWPRYPAADLEARYPMLYSALLDQLGEPPHVAPRPASWAGALQAARPGAAPAGAPAGAPGRPAPLQPLAACLLAQLSGSMSEEMRALAEQTLARLGERGSAERAQQADLVCQELARLAERGHQHSREGMCWLLARHAPGLAVLARLYAWGLLYTLDRWLVVRKSAALLPEVARRASGQ